MSIDVDRLAQAMSKVAYPDPGDAWPTAVKDVKDLYRHQARAIAREYDRLAPADTGLREPYVLAQAARQAEYERAQRAEVVARAAADLIESMSWKAGVSAYWVQTLGDDRALYERLRDAVAVWLADQPEGAKA